MRFRAFVMLLIASLGFATACTPPTTSPAPTKKPGPVVPDHGANKLIHITFTIRGIPQGVTHLAAPGGQDDRTLLNASTGPGPNAEVTAYQDGPGFLSCLITYQFGANKLYIVDYEHNNASGHPGVHCVVNHQKIAFAMIHSNPKTIPQPAPEGCVCEPDTITLNVTWLKR